MNPHFFTAPFYFAFIWFKVQGSRFRALVAASPPFFRRWYSRIAAFPSMGRRPAGAERGGGMKVRDDMRIKQAIYGSSQAPVFANGAARKRYSSHQSREAPNP